MRQIKHWTVANGGAPAVVIVGLGLIAVSPLLGTILVVLGSVWFIVRLDPVRKWLIGLLGGDAETSPNTKDDLGGFTIAHAGEVHVHAQGGQPAGAARQVEGRRQEIRLADIVNERTFVIRGKTYEDVDFIGPAIIALSGTQVYEPRIPGDLDATFWRLPNDKKEIVGAIVFDDCILRRCRFFAIGFAIPEKMWPEIEANTTVHDGPMPAA